MFQGELGLACSTRGARGGYTTRIDHTCNAQLIRATVVLDEALNTFFVMAGISMLIPYHTKSCTGVIAGGAAAVKLSHSFVRSFIRTFIHSFVRSFVRSFIHSFIHPSIHSSNQAEPAPSGCEET